MKYGGDIVLKIEFSLRGLQLLTKFVDGII